MRRRPKQLLSTPVTPESGLPAIIIADVYVCHIAPQPTVWDIDNLLDSGMDMSMQLSCAYISGCLLPTVQHRQITPLPNHWCVQSYRPGSSGIETRLRKCSVMWHQWTIAETATRATFGGACNYAAAAPRPPPHHASVDSATLAAGSRAHNIQDTVFYLPSDARPSARIHRRHEYGIYAGSPPSLRRKPSPESITP